MKQKDRRRNPERRHGDWDQHREVKWILSVILAVILFTIVMSLQGCVTTKPEDLATSNTINICLLSWNSCEQDNVADRLGHPEATGSSISEEVDQTNTSSQGAEGGLDAEVSIPESVVSPLDAL